MESKEQPKQIEVAKATPEDVRGIQEVYYQTWLATYPNEEIGITEEDIEDKFRDRFSEDALHRSAEHLLHPSEGETILLAKEGGRVVGVCRAIVRPEINQLQTIYVLPEYQGRGVGTSLWKEAQRYFDPGKDIIVQVATYNFSAIKFYESLGFEDTEKRWMDERFRMKSGAVIPEMELILRR